MATLDKFENYLRSKQLVPDKQLPYYLHWVERFLFFCEKNATSPDNAAQLTAFLHLLAKNKEEWQVSGAEANSAIPADAQAAWQRLAQQMREALRLRHRSIRTEK